MTITFKEIFSKWNGFHNNFIWRLSSQMLTAEKRTKETNLLLFSKKHVKEIQFIFTKTDLKSLH